MESQLRELLPISIRPELKNNGFKTHQLVQFLMTAIIIAIPKPFYTNGDSFGVLTSASAFQISTVNKTCELPLSTSSSQIRFSSFRFHLFVAFVHINSSSRSIAHRAICQAWIHLGLSSQYSHYHPNSSTKSSPTSQHHLFQI